MSKAQVILEPKVIGHFNQKLVEAGLLRPIKTLSLDPENARDHGERSVEGIARSMVRYAQQKPVVASAEGVVVAGNGMLRAAQSLGWTHLLATVTDLDTPAARAYAIADNRMAELSAWDEPALEISLRDLAKADFSLDDLGFTETDLSAFRLPDWAAKVDGQETRPTPATPSEAVTVRILDISRTGAVKELLRTALAEELKAGIVELR